MLLAVRYQRPNGRSLSHLVVWHEIGKWISRHSPTQSFIHEVLQWC